MKDYSICISEITVTEIKTCENAHSFLQSAMWGEFKSRFGWTAKAFLINWRSVETQETSLQETQETSTLLVLCRRLAPGFSFAYVPWGPELPASFPQELKPLATAQLADKLKPFLSRNTSFIRFEPPWRMDKEQRTESKEQRTENKEQRTENKEQRADNNEMFLAVRFRKAAAVVQPPDTVIVDLTPSCEEILAAMKPKWRYNVLLAGKKGVQVHSSGNSGDVSGGTNELEIFYKLLKETALRDGIAVHHFDYYKTLFELCNEGTHNSIEARLYTASHEGDFLASIFVLFRGEGATYLYGASSNNKRNLMAPYALQWKAMQDAKEARCRRYDLFGIPPNEDPNHPMAGLYRFKTGFGGQIIHRAGSWDYVYKSFFYNLFNFAEGLRKKLRDLKKKSNR